MTREEGGQTVSRGEKERDRDRMKRESWKREREDRDRGGSTEWGKESKE